MSDPEVEEEEVTQVNSLGDAIQRWVPDSFSGAFRGVKTPKRGGPAYVKPEDTLGDAEHCWCGEPAGHDWPGKAARAKHPPIQERKGSTMGAAARNDVPRLEMRDLRKFDQRVARMMMELVNTYGVRWRMQRDGQHVLLYPLNGAFEGRPHKVGAARHAEQTLDHLERWVTEAVTPALVASSAELLAAKFNDPSKARKARAAARHTDERKDAPVSAVAVAPPPVKNTRPSREQVEAMIRETEEYKTLPEGARPAPEGYIRAIGQNKKILSWWVNADKTHYLCMFCDFEADDLWHNAAHMRVHTQTPEQLRNAASKGNRAKLARLREEENTKNGAVIQDALANLFKTLGVSMPASGEAEIADLKAQVATLTEERDSLRAKLDLIREGLSL